MTLRTSHVITWGVKNTSKIVTSHDPCKQSTCITNRPCERLEKACRKWQQGRRKQGSNNLLLENSHTKGEKRALLMTHMLHISFLGWVQSLRFWVQSSPEVVPTPIRTAIMPFIERMDRCDWLLAQSILFELGTGYQGTWVES